MRADELLKQVLGAVHDQGLVLLQLSRQEFFHELVKQDAPQAAAGHWERQLERSIDLAASDASSNVSDTFDLNIVQSQSPDINLSETDDHFISTGLGEVINGLGGNDTVQGGAGNDRDNGNDNIDGGSGANVLHGNDGGDYLTSIGNLNTSFGDGGQDQLFFIGNQNQLFGSEGSDWLGVGGNDNALAGGAGDEWIGATGNSNTLAGQAGTDFLFAVGAGNALHGEAGNDWLGVSGNSNRLPLLAERLAGGFCRLADRDVLSPAIAAALRAGGIRRNWEGSICLEWSGLSCTPWIERGLPISIEQRWPEVRHDSLISL